jgi:1-acyl-sn-glycerol-3-phosphate acyltransferase
MLVVVGSSFFIAPYILFASVAGWLADRFKKSQVIFACKIAEIVIMSIGVLAVMMMGAPAPGVRIDPCFFLLLAAVFLMGTQSALFAPAKVGTIPELLDESNIAAGNGIFNLATLSATVIGMAMGGWLSDRTLRGQQDLWIAAAVLVGIAVIGTLFSLMVKSLPAANRRAKFPVTLIGETIADLLQLFAAGKLFRVALGVAFFWSVAAFAQLNIDFFSEESGGLVESHRTPLLIAVTMGIGLGSVLAGYISAGRIDLGLVPWGAAGIALFAFLLWLAPADFILDQLLNWKMIVACSCLFGLGMGAGVFDVPLSSYLQHNSPIEKRGSILAATNCLAFSGILVMFGLLAIMRYPAYSGSLANLPSSLTAASLDETQRSNLTSLLNEYKAQPGLLESKPNIKSFADRVDPQIRPVVVTELAYLDASLRRDQEKSALFNDYLEDYPADAENVFPQEARLIKHATLQAGKLPLLSSRQVFLVIGLLTLPVCAYGFYRLAQPAVRLIFWLLLKLLYRVKVTGQENVPHQGGGIVVSNHSCWLDGVIMVVFVPRIPRTIAWAGNFKNRLMTLWAKFCGVILITGGPKSIKKGLDIAKKAIADGDLVGIFPEGGISRTCQIRTLKPGLSKIIDPDNPVPIIPVFFAETYGSLFSFSGGRAFTKMPDAFRRPLSVHLGKPITEFKSMFQLQQALQRLSADSVENRVGKFVAPAAALVKSCKKKKFKSKIGDSTNQEETGGSLLTRSLVLRRLLRKHVLEKTETNVGILIPPTVGGAIVNLAVTLDKRVAINLNYSLSEDLINYCIKSAGIKHVLTTRKVMDKFGFKLDCDVIYLEDLKVKVTSRDKGIAAFQSYLVPAGMLCRVLGLNRLKPNDLMTIVYTSGSTGVPKGVMLSQRNIMTNVQGINQVASFVPGDTMVGILPFFHSMGYTATLWAPMACNLRGVYHFSPLDAKVIGKLVEKFSGTLIVATPTFLRSYMRRCTPEQFQTLNTVVAGAERLPVELCDEFEQKFGVRPAEGYGTTELSPITSVNIPLARQDGGKFQIDNKDGTVGRPLPNVAAKVTDLDSGEELGPNIAGMLWIKGPNVMLGYLDDPAATAEVLVDGWYKTGDVAIIDEDGFIKITGRMSRFSKIGGEMVPHLKIEEVLTALLHQVPAEGAVDEVDDHLLVAVTAVPDEKKGERLIVLHAAIGRTVDEMQGALKDAGLPNLFIPTADSFFQVEKLPLLGTGKLDLKGIKDMALEVTAK